jgi:hypothetical protein
MQLEKMNRTFALHPRDVVYAVVVPRDVHRTDDLSVSAGECLGPTLAQLNGRPLTYKVVTAIGEVHNAASLSAAKLGPLFAGLLD